MPRLDGTGPQGQGPRTGRSMGNCPGTGGSGKGLGFGRGQGRGQSRFCPGCPLKKNQPIIKEDKKIIEEKPKGI